MVPAGLDRGSGSLHFRVPPPSETGRGLVLADDTVVLSENPEEEEEEEEESASGSGGT